MKQLTSFLVGLVACAFLLSAAHAATFTATELSYDKALLSSFNLINLGNYTTSNETEGRILVGGNATVTSGGTNVCFNGGCGGNTSFGAQSSTTNGLVASQSTTANSSPNQGYGALTVFGSLTGGFNVMNGGDIDVQGNVGAGTSYLHNGGGFNLGGSSASGAVVDSPTEVRATTAQQNGRTQNYSGANAQTGLSLSSVFPFGSSASVNFGDPLTKLAQGLANLPGTPGVKAQALPANQSNNPLIAGADLTVNGKSYGVVTTTLANLAAEQNFGGIANGNGNAATIVVVTGNTANAVLPTLNYTDSKVLYDFVNATSFATAGGWNASILAPLATITSQGGTINGGVVVASINQTNELHQGNLFTGDLTGLYSSIYTSSPGRVPEPASLLLMAAALATAALARTRRARHHVA